MLFKNTHIRDERIIREAYKYIAFRQPFFVFIMCIFIFIVAFETGLLLTGRSDDPTVPVLAAFCMGYTYYKYRKTVKTTVKRNREEADGSDITYTTSVTKKNITAVSSTGEKYKLEYSDIKNCGIMKDVIIVLSKNNTSYIFTTDGFEIGTAKGFIQFLKDRGVKIYGKLE
ncbi:MAG: hypothetical protein IKM61_04080 [Eubacteriaceae bacterium]|nr:hypothetical protein [Eubacteriaceae bacterium]